MIRSPASLGSALRVRAHRHRPDPVSQRLRRLRRHAVTRSPFYARHHAGRERAPLDELPPMTKALLLESFDDMLTDRAVHRADLEVHLRVAEPGTAVDVALELAAGIARNGPLAVAATKTILNEQWDWAEEDFWHRQGEISGPVLVSEDAREGAVAFKEKRDPVWKGR